MDTIWDRKSFEVGGHCGGDEKPNDHTEPTKSNAKKTKQQRSVTCFSLPCNIVTCFCLQSNIVTCFCLQSNIVACFCLPCNSVTFFSLLYSSVTCFSLPYSSVTCLWKKITILRPTVRRETRSRSTTKK